jgi:UDP-N-acetylmuramate--alanine ligase
MKQYSQIYVLGIGGIGMSALARWFLREGKLVFGHDMHPTTLTDQLVQEGIPVHYEVGADAIPLAVLDNPQDTLVLYTPSISTKHPIWQYLSQHGYRLCKRGEILDMITKEHYTLAVAGTHGKTTSTSLAAHILCYAQTNVTAFLGGIAKNYNTNFIASDNTEEESTIVIEADEFDRFFLQLHPDIAIVTTVDPDHLEVYENAQGFEEGFKQFLAKISPEGIAVLHQSVADKLIDPRKEYPFRVVTYALKNAPICANNVRIDEAGQFYFDYQSPDVTIKDIRLPVPGYHNVENALAIITACLHMHVPPATIVEGMDTFEGVARRFDHVLNHRGIVLLDDYGHHPVEITVLLQTVRTVYPGKRITVVFRPNQYSRTRDFLDEIAASLDLADCVLILEIYTDREDPIEGITPEAILQRMQIPAKYACTKENLISCLEQAGEPEIIVNLGAGDSDEFLQPIQEFILKNY